MLEFLRSLHLWFWGYRVPAGPIGVLDQKVASQLPDVLREATAIVREGSDR